MEIQFSKIIMEVHNMLSLALTVFMIVCMWMIFEKLDIEGWKCLIPFYNSYVLFKRLYTVTAFIIGIVAAAVLFFSTIALATSAVAGIAGLFDVFGVFEKITVAGILIPVILITASTITLLVLTVILYVKLSEKFGKSGAFAVGLIFLSPIFLGILAFDPQAQPVDKMKEEDTPVQENEVSVQPAVEVEREEFIFTDPIPGEGMKICPFCKAEIEADATRCPYCRSDLS